MSTTDKTHKELAEMILHLISVISSEYSDMHKEISRMKNIINEASGNLHETFRGFQKENKLFQERMGQETTDKPSTETAKDNSYFLKKGITALQFEDIVQQMLNHTNTRIQILESLMIELNKHFAVFLDNPSDEKLKEIIAACELEINNSRKNLLLENPVTQSSLDNGDITLF